MYVFRFGLAVPTEADIGSSGLEVFRVGAGRDFPVFALGREPNFNIVGLGSGEAQIAGAQANHMVRQFQGLEDPLSIIGEFFQLVIAAFRSGIFHHFYLVELVLTNQAPGIPAGRTGFSPEAGGQCRYVDGKLGPINDFLPVVVGQRYFGGRNQVHILVFHLVHIFLEFRQLARTRHGSGADNVRRNHFRIAVLLGMLVQHEVVDRTFQMGTGTHIVIEPGTGNLGSPFSIQDAQVFANFPVVFRFKIVFRQFAPFPHFGVFTIVLAYRNICCRHIGNGQHNGVQTGFHILQLFIAFGDFVTQSAHGQDFLRSIFSVFLHLADLGADRIPLALVSFYFLQQVSALLIQLFEFVQVHLRLTIFDGLKYFVRIFPNKFQI